MFAYLFNKLNGDILVCRVICAQNVIRLKFDDCCYCMSEDIMIVNECTVMNTLMLNCPYLHIPNLSTRSHLLKGSNRTKYPSNNRTCKLAFILYS